MVHFEMIKDDSIFPKEAKLKERARWKSLMVFLTAGILSIMWMLVLWWLTASLSLQTALNRLHHLRSMEPNAIGDFLAGAFAPLALIWLIATAWLQRQGLEGAFKSADAAVRANNIAQEARRAWVAIESLNMERT